MTADSAVGELGQIEAALAGLRKDRLRNINLLNFAENPVSSVERIGDSVLLRGKSDQDWVYISSPNEEELALLKARLTREDRYFAAIEDWMLPILTGDAQIVWHLSMIQFHLPDAVVLPEPARETVSLSVGDARVVYEESEYRDVLSLEYVAERIERGMGVGMREAGQLVAWAMTQDDGGMGFIHVQPAYRRRGYGYNVALSLIHALRKAGKLPFAYVEETNAASINLLSKLGLIEDKRVHWFHIQ